MKLIQVAATSAAVIGLASAAPVDDADMSKMMKDFDKFNKGKFSSKMINAITQIAMESYMKHSQDMDMEGMHNEFHAKSPGASGSSNFGDHTIVINGNVNINNAGDMDGKDRPEKPKKDESEMATMEEMKMKIEARAMEYIECDAAVDSVINRYMLHKMYPEDYMLPEELEEGYVMPMSESMTGSYSESKTGSYSESKTGSYSPSQEDPKDVLIRERRDDHGDGESSPSESEMEVMTGSYAESGKMPEMPAADKMEMLMHHMMQKETIEEFYDTYGEMLAEYMNMENWPEEEKMYHEAIMQMVSEDWRDLVTMFHPYNVHMKFKYCVAIPTMKNKIESVREKKEMHMDKDDHDHDMHHENGEGYEDDHDHEIHHADDAGYKYE